MPYKTIVVDDDPWMVCDASSSDEIDDVVAKSGITASDVQVRDATPKEARKLAAEKALKAAAGEDPDKLFGTSL